MALDVPLLRQVSVTSSVKDNSSQPGEHWMPRGWSSGSDNNQHSLHGSIASRDRRTYRLVEQRYDWDAISRRFVAQVEETVQTRRSLSPDGS